MASAWPFKASARAAEALQADGGVAQLDVDFLVRPDHLVVEHHRAAEPVGVVVPSVEEVELRTRAVLEERIGRPQVAGDLAECEVEDRPNTRSWATGKSQPHAAGERHAGPLDRDGACFLPVGGDERRVVAAVRDAAFQVDRRRTADGEAAGELGHGDLRITRAAAVDRQRARGQVRYDRVAHQAEHAVGDLLDAGAGDRQGRLLLRLRQRGAGRDADPSEQAE